MLAAIVLIPYISKSAIFKVYGRAVRTCGPLIFAGGDESSSKSYILEFVKEKSGVVPLFSDVKMAARSINVAACALVGSDTHPSLTPVRTSCT